MEERKMCLLSMKKNCLNPYCNGRYSWSLFSHLIFIVMIVLILIVMEDTHGVCKFGIRASNRKVLILIVMEDTHGGNKKNQKVENANVLILIVMEDTHGGLSSKTIPERRWGLNPYCNGRYSWSSLVDSEAETKVVLILIVMEDTHGELQGVL